MVQSFAEIRSVAIFWTASLPLDGAYRCSCALQMSTAPVAWPAASNFPFPAPIPAYLSACQMQVDQSLSLLQNSWSAIPLGFCTQPASSHLRQLPCIASATPSHRPVRGHTDVQAVVLADCVHKATTVREAAHASQQARASRHNKADPATVPRSRWCMSQRLQPLSSPADLPDDRRAELVEPAPSHRQTSPPVRCQCAGSSLRETYILYMECRPEASLSTLGRRSWQPAQ